MSRRHSSSRRRAYGKRQHEVRERRPEPFSDLTGGPRRTSLESIDERRFVGRDDDLQSTTDGLGTAGR